MISLFDHFLALFYSFTIYIGIPKPQSLILPPPFFFFLLYVHGIILHTFLCVFGFFGSILCQCCSSMLGCVIAFHSLSLQYSILLHDIIYLFILLPIDILTVLQRFVCQLMNLHGCDLRERRLTLCLQAMMPCPELPRPKSGAYRKQLPCSAWAPRLLSPLGLGFTRQAESSLHCGLALAGKSHCPRLGSGAIMPQRMYRPPLHGLSFLTQIWKSPCELRTSGDSGLEDQSL